MNKVLLREGFFKSPIELFFQRLPTFPLQHDSTVTNVDIIDLHLAFGQHPPASDFD